jgi:hypothetical protein
MNFDAQSITLLIFAAINFSIVFIVKTRTSLVISVILSHLIALLFLSLSITNFQVFRELTLAIVIYSMAILFVISNFGLINVENNDLRKIWQRYLAGALIISFGLIIFISSLFLISKVIEAENSAIESYSQISKDPVTFSEMKKAKMRDKIASSFLFKHSSDVMILIASAIALSLILSKKEK